MATFDVVQSLHLELLILVIIVPKHMYVKVVTCSRIFPSTSILKITLSADITLFFWTLIRRPHFVPTAASRLTDVSSSRLLAMKRLRRLHLRLLILLPKLWIHQWTSICLLDLRELFDTIFLYYLCRSILKVFKYLQTTWKSSLFTLFHLITSHVIFSSVSAKDVKFSANFGYFFLKQVFKSQNHGMTPADFDIHSWSIDELECKISSVLPRCVILKTCLCYAFRLL